MAKTIRVYAWCKGWDAWCVLCLGGLCLHTCMHEFMDIRLCASVPLGLACKPVWACKHVSVMYNCISVFAWLLLRISACTNGPKVNLVGPGRLPVGPMAACLFLQVFVWVYPNYASATSNCTCLGSERHIGTYFYSMKVILRRTHTHIYIYTCICVSAICIYMHVLLM